MKKVHTIAGIGAVFIVSIFLLGVFEPVFSPSYRCSTATPVSSSAPSSLESSLSHLIQGVPYVGQETDFFCSYASCTMVFQYFGINTTLHEVVFYSGVGYSVFYNTIEPIVSGGYRISQQDEDVRFISSLYGFAFESWDPTANNVTAENAWDRYWFSVKQNISNNIPIITSVDPFVLPSIRNQFDVPQEFWSRFTSGHGIVIVGYNESNGTVCYNDPAAELYGDASLGNYAWMDVSLLHEAIDKLSIGTKYLIDSFHKVSEPLSKEIAFEYAHKRNIERMNGNISAYDPMYRNNSQLKFGIQALKSLEYDFGRGLHHRIRSIILYKLTGLNKRILNRRTIIQSFIGKIPLSVFKRLNPQENEYGRIALEKKYAADYLKTRTGIQGNNNEASLFVQEAEQWSKLSDFFNLFMKRGLFITLPRSLFVMKQMQNAVKTSISLEEEIIADAT